jgi:pseudouridine-5'-monophosphatase
VAAEYGNKQKQVLAGRVGMNALRDDWQLGEVDDGWAESISSLEDFDYRKYGIEVL